LALDTAAYRRDIFHIDFPGNFSQPPEVGVFLTGIHVLKGKFDLRVTPFSVTNGGFEVSVATNGS